MNQVRGKTVIMIATVPWHFYWQRQQEWAVRFAEHNDVLYVAPFGSTNMGPFKILSKISARWSAPTGPQHQVAPERVKKINHIKPRLIPWHGVHWINKLNGWLFERQVRSCISSDNKDIILWICNPADTSLAIIERFPGARVVYDIAMRFAKRTDVGKNLELSQNILARHADHIIYDAPASLTDLPPETHRKATLVPQGVHEQFLKEPKDARNVSLQKIARPRIGYVGAQNDALDAALIQKLVVSMPHAQIVLIGDFLEPDSYLEHERIHKLGAIPFEQLPDLMRQLDIGIVPYLVNDFTAGVFPTKVLEYLAVGLPVISTRLPALKFLGAAVTIADNPQEFSAACKKVLDAGASPIGADYLAKHTWQSRFEVINSVLTMQNS